MKLCVMYKGHNSGLFDFDFGVIPPSLNSIYAFFIWTITLRHNYPLQQWCAACDNAASGGY